jgi:outer membrane protein insertion porin family
MPGTLDQVDVTVKVEEQSAGSLQFGVGYSQYSGIILSTLGVAEQHLRHRRQLHRSAASAAITSRSSAQLLQPVSDRQQYRHRLQRHVFQNRLRRPDFADYSTSTKASLPIWASRSPKPMAARQLGISSNKVNLIPGYSPQVLIDYRTKSARHHPFVDRHTGLEPRHAQRLLGTDAVAADLGHGGHRIAGLDRAVLEIHGEANHYWPIGKGFVLYLDGRWVMARPMAAMASAIANSPYLQTPSPTTPWSTCAGFPVLENFYSGGVTDVRGFQDNTLGPRVCIAGGPITAENGYCPGSYAQPIGGAFKVLGTAELYLPLPFLKDINTARVSVVRGRRQCLPEPSRSFTQAPARLTGISLHWQAPIGPLIISLAIRSAPRPTTAITKNASSSPSAASSNRWIKSAAHAALSFVPPQTGWPECAACGECIERTSYSVAELAERFELTSHGDGDASVSTASVHWPAPGPSQLSFLSNSKYDAQLAATHAGVVVLREENLPTARLLR